MQLELIERPSPIVRASQRAVAGMDRVRDAVESESPGWSEKALDAVRRFAAQQAGMFTTEGMRSVIQKELPATTRLRVWGPVTKAAVAKGYIEPVKGAFAPAASSNGSPKRMYRRGPKA
jgi:hypothetical protein